MRTCPRCNRQIEDESPICHYCGADFIVTSKPMDSVSAPGSVFRDPSKGISLLFGILLFLTIYGLTESIIMLYTGRHPSLVELIIFVLLAADAIVLLISVRGKKDEKNGLFEYASVWILGLIPYFGWVAVYWAGKGFADVIQRRKVNAPAIALLLFIGIIILCLGVYIFVSDSAWISPLAQP